MSFGQHDTLSPSSYEQKTNGAPMSICFHQPINKNYTIADWRWLAMLMVIAGGASLSRASDGDAARPNIIFIMADDLGYGDLGCYGQQHIKTPHIDRLADQGLRFSNCYAGSTVCAPSRSVLMTGLHTGHTTVRGNHGRVATKNGKRKNGRVPLNAEDVTVAEVLKTVGYTTGMAGKWGLGEPNTTGEPLRQGFDQFYGYLNQRRAHSYFPDYLWHNQTKVLLPENKQSPQTYSQDLIVDFALEFVRNHHDKPFFLYLPFCLPHGDYEIPSTAPYDNPSWTERERTFAAMVGRLDLDVGRITALLDELDIAQNTLVFFCSDNGAAIRFDKRFGSSGELRGKKRDMYEGGIRTPMIVRWPDQIAPGSKSDLAWYFADVLPTLADVTGTEVPANLDGVSVLPTLLGNEQNLRDRYLYWEFFERGFRQASRRGDWKAIRNAPGDKLELYNLANDPSETINVASGHAEVVQDFENYLQSARTQSYAWPIE